MHLIFQQYNISTNNRAIIADVCLPLATPIWKNDSIFMFGMVTRLRVKVLLLSGDSCKSEE